MGINKITENLDKNVTELTKRERDSLNDINPKDYEKTRESVGNLKIEAHGETVSIKDAVKQIAAGARNYEGIATQNQALIQAYLVMRGENIGTFQNAKHGIDGKIGEKSKKAIKNAAIKIKSQEKEEAQEQRIQQLEEDLKRQQEKVERMGEDDLRENIQKLSRAYFSDVLGEYSDGYYLLEYNKHRLRKVEITDDNKLNISYKSKVTGEYATITVTPVKFGEQYSRKDTAKNIIKELNKNEKALENGEKYKESLQSIEEGIKTITSNNFENPIVKKFFKDTPNRFSLPAQIVPNKITIKYGENVYNFSKDQILTDGKFDENKFCNNVTEQALNKAIGYTHKSYKDRLDTATKTIPEIKSISSNDSRKRALNNISQELKTINNYNPIYFKKETTRVQELQDMLLHQENYIRAEQKFTNGSIAVKQKLDAWFTSTHDLGINAKNELIKIGITVLTKTEGGVLSFSVNHNNDIHKAYQEANKEDEYNKKMKEIQKLFNDKNMRFDI